MNVGVIGLGRMGQPIAKNILSAGHRLHVHDIRPTAGEELVSLGATWCRDPAEVASVSECIISSLPGPQEVEIVMRGARGVLQAIAPGAVVVETSTINPILSRALAPQFSERGAYYLDAPVSGGSEGAVGGALTIMVGGDPAALERARPVIESFCKQIFHLGPTGAGNTMKLVIQAIYLSQMAAFLEGLSLGEEAGIPTRLLLEIIAGSSAHHPTIGKRYEMLIANDLRPRFEVDGAIKDLTLAEEMCAGTSMKAEIMRAALAAYRRAAEFGLSKKDLIALRNMLRQNTRNAE